MSDELIKVDDKNLDDYVILLFVLKLIFIDK